VAGNLREHAEAFVASDYQGETIQVFVFFRGKFLGYQCFAQDRITIGAGPGMDLVLPDCLEKEYWDVYVYRGALYVWFRGPAGGNKAEGGKDPRKVQPLDSFPLGGYRLQVKLLQPEGLVQPTAGSEEGLSANRVAAGSSTPLEQAPRCEEPEEVVGISLEYARSIWRGSEEKQSTEASGAGKERTEPSEQPAEQVRQGGTRCDRETQGSETDEPEAIDEAVRESHTTEEWIGFGLEEESLPEEGVQAEGAEEDRLQPETHEGPPSGQVACQGSQSSEQSQTFDAGQERPVAEELVSLDEKTGVFGQTRQPDDLPEPLDIRATVPLGVAAEDSPQLPLVSEPAGLIQGMSREERTRFWDEMAKEALVNEDETKEPVKPEETPPEDSPDEGLGDRYRPEGAVGLDHDRTSAREPAMGRERFESAQTAVEMDSAEIVEEEEQDESWQEGEEEEEDITYFSLLKEIFPSRTDARKGFRGERRALEVVRFRGGELQEIGYLEGGGSYTIRKGWSRSLWKRRGGVPPNFKLVRVKDGGLAELHIRESVKGRLYSESGSQDIGDVQGAKRKRLGRIGRAPWLPMPADAWAVLRVNSGRYLVRYVSPRPKPAVQPLRPSVSVGQFKLVSLSLLSHFLLILVIGLAVPDRTLEGYSRVDQFARIDPEAVRALKPPPPPKEIEKPPPPPKKEVSKPVPRPTPASKRSVPKSAQSPTPAPQGKAQAGGGGKKEVDVAQTGLLAALGGPDSGVLDGKGNSEILLAAVTNLDAVAVPSDTTTFNLAGVAGRLATSEIQVPTSDVIETVGAAQLLKNGDGTLGALASKGTGQVRGIVHEPPKANISIRGGMSREAVLKVVNTHLDEIRDCYERELLHSPGISGKILLEWLIQLDGTVRYAKVKFTNIGHSSDLHGCMQAQVVTWQFPRPQGGEEVLVTFPFLFESMGF
jgi:hypothetical protein